MKTNLSVQSGGFDLLKREIEDGFNEVTKRHNGIVNRMREDAKWYLPQFYELGRELAHVKNLYERGEKGKASKFYEDAERRCHLKKASVCNYIQLHQNWDEVLKHHESGEAPYILTMSDAMDFIRKSGLFAPQPLASAADPAIGGSSEEVEEAEDAEVEVVEELSATKPKQRKMVCKKTEPLHEAVKQLDALANLQSLNEDSRDTAEYIRDQLEEFIDEIEEVYGKWVEIEDSGLPLITPATQVAKPDEWVHPQNPEPPSEKLSESMLRQAKELQAEGKKPYKIGVVFPIPEYNDEFTAAYKEAGGTDLGFSKVTPWSRDTIAKHRKAIEAVVNSN